MFWRFSRDILPADASVEQQTSPTGDLCHNNIAGMSKQQCRALFRERVIADFKLCDEGLERALTVEDVERQASRSGAVIAGSKKNTC